LWKVHCPQKDKIFMWYLIVNKVPTWDKMKNKHFEGPCWCSLCKLENETVLHLFLLCLFVHHIWQEIVVALGQNLIWAGPSIEQAWGEWSSNRYNRRVKSLPLIVPWGVWIARNLTIFKDKSPTPNIIATQGPSILSHFPWEKDGGPIRVSPSVQIDRSIP